MRLMMLIHSLGPGGAEKVLVQLANGLVARGDEVTINILGSRSDACIYPLDPRVRLVHLGLNRQPHHKGVVWTIMQSLKLVRGVRQFISSAKPELLIAFITKTNIFALLATVGTGLPVIISERCDPSITPLGRIWRVARQITYPFASALVVQSREVHEWFPPWIRRICWVIPNPILKPIRIHSAPTTRHMAHRVIAVGRLDYQKGFDILLAAFEQVATRFPDWSLEIWGEGPLREELETQRNRLRLQDRVQFPGITHDIQARYAEADIFVLSSRFEGFPNALCEAMASNLPVVATSCSGAVRDIIRNGDNGILVPVEDAAALANALSLLIPNHSLQTSLGSQAGKVVNKFSLDFVLDHWELCLKKAQG